MEKFIVSYSSGFATFDTIKEAVVYAVTKTAEEDNCIIINCVRNGETTRHIVIYK